MTTRSLGWRSSLVIGEQSVPGTPNTSPGLWLPYCRSTVGVDRKWKPVGTLMSRQVQRHLPGIQYIAGQLTLPIQPAVVAELFKLWAGIGSCATTGPVAGIYTHTITPTEWPLSGPCLTPFTLYDQPAMGDGQAARYTGCYLNTFTLDSPDSQAIVTSRWDVVGLVADDTSASSPNYVHRDDPLLLSWGSRLSIGGTTVLPLESWSLTGTNNLSALKPRGGDSLRGWAAGTRVITGAMSVAWDRWDRYRGLIQSQAFALQLTLGTASYGIVLSMPVCTYDRAGAPLESPGRRHEKIPFRVANDAANETPDLTVTVYCGVGTVGA